MRLETHLNFRFLPVDSANGDKWVSDFSQANGQTVCQATSCGNVRESRFNHKRLSGPWTHGLFMKTIGPELQNSQLTTYNMLCYTKYKTKPITSNQAIVTILNLEWYKCQCAYATWPHDYMPKVSEEYPIWLSGANYQSSIRLGTIVRVIARSLLPVTISTQLFFSNNEILYTIHTYITK